MNKLGLGIFILVIISIIALWSVPGFGVVSFGKAATIVGITSLVWGIYSAYHARWIAFALCMIAVFVLLLLLANVAMTP